MVGFPHVAAGAIHYVNVASTNAVWPHATWATAAYDIQDAILGSKAGDEVLVTNGTYAAYVGAGVQGGGWLWVHSVNGPEVTVIDVGGTPWGYSGSSAGRGGILEGFTITNAPIGSISALYLGAGGTVRDCTIIGNRSEQSAGGVWMEGGVMENSRIIGNTATYYGGGVRQSGGVIRDCLISNNIAGFIQSNGVGYGTGGGVWMRGGVITNCTITGNYSHQYGGGIGCWSMMTNAWIQNSRIVGNIASNNAGGVMLEDRAVLSNCLVADNSTAWRGGGVQCYGGGSLVDCVISNNAATEAADSEGIGARGGGLYFRIGGYARGCTITQNRSANLGGGVYLSQVGVLDSCLVSDNVATNSGGGINIVAAGLVTNCVVSGNRGSDGGGIYCLRDGSYGGAFPGGLLVGNDVQGNVATNDGGGVYSWGGVGTIRGGRIRDNVAGRSGGGIAFTPAISDVAVENNSALVGGGIALSASYGATSVARCTVVSNTAVTSAGIGGGLYAEMWASVLQCRFLGNTAAGGGGMYANGGVAVANSLFADNRADDDGAGLYATDGTSIQNCTFAGNIAQNLGGGIYSGEIVVQNSIVFGNTALAGANAFNTGTGGSWSYCCTVPANGSPCITSPPLFSGASSGDYRLASGSPCIDTGSNDVMPAGADVDGVARPLDGDANGVAVVDIGCHEFASSGADTDGDGTDDSAEVTADTDAADGTSHLELLGVNVADGHAVVAWQGGVRATQRLERCESLASEPPQWQAVFTNLPPTRTSVQFTDDTPAGSTVFYRIKASR